jgi:hypothetical protein
VKELCIIPAGERKIWAQNPKTGPTKAVEAYIGPFTGMCRKYAEKFYPGAWCFISAKYGFLLPDDIVRGPYNEVFAGKIRGREANPISLEQLSIIAAKKGLDAYDQIAVLGGKVYVDITRQVFPEKEVSAPLSGSPGMGYMMSKLSKSLRSGAKL